ncbi:MAG: septum formation initiator family protein [Ignavibacteriaceae bacterium]|jgi:cell division protein FtsB|nr:septum formation initiator family protein [Ignavibacteriaceae bacterium]
MKKKNIKSLLISLIILLLGISTIAFIVFNESGLLNYIKSKNRLDEINKNIDISNDSIKTLESEIDSLKYNRFKKEKTAREKYRMFREDEKPIEIEEK